MWDAVANALTLVIPGGTVFIALYNDQGWISRYWTAVKRSYNRGAIRRSTLIGLHWPYLVGLRATVRFLSRRPRSERGMNLWHDMKDWLGGWPFEVATPTEVQTYFMGRGFRLTKSSLCGRRHGCNEFVFVSTSGNE
jgi:2-polyprenyl-6-hydroxyphenyl methylase/3-demethylubiquinone-9 3-methyltransferase